MLSDNITQKFLALFVYVIVMVVVFYEDGVHENIHGDNTQIIYFHPAHSIYTEIILNTEDVTKNQYNYYESAEDLHMKKLRMMQVIADAEKAVAVAGVMGGAGSDGKLLSAPNASTLASARVRRISAKNVKRLLRGSSRDQ